MPTRLPVLEVDAAHIDEACVVRVQDVDRLRIRCGEGAVRRLIEVAGAERSLPLVA